MAQESDFAALIGSRICHDLISPVGAINNGIELIQMTTPSLGPELALISESVTNASARIRFFRIAFGAAGEQLVGRQEVISILKDVYVDTRLTVVWGPVDGQSRKKVRLTLLALMCLETGMPYGGRIEVAQDGGNLIVTGHADKFKVDETLWGSMNGSHTDDDLRPAQVQFGLLPFLAEQDGFTVDLKINDNRITIQI
ncbi:histidine phosphotransferase family protein [uncultured Sulfitobacter sp.]|uniref:histidine phosphotransferase family protein n=1 Tax=uncultured Sulfitobacter sp. TaxID=191468 RepID=UPI00260D61EF|nr:histidine phosphotransferase family protein [uncultured Sulfitobacter sp.]